MRALAGSGADIIETGRYRLEPLAFDVTREMSFPEGSVRMSYRGVGSTVWIRIEDLASSGRGSQVWPCWVDIDEITGLAGAVPQGLAPPSGQPPAAVVAASYGVGQRTVGKRVKGTIDLALTLSLISGKLLMASGVDPSGDATAPASFTLDGAMLAGFTVELDDLVSAVESAEGPLPPELDGFFEALTGAVEARFTDAGAPISVSSPAEDKILKVTDPDNFDAAMADCGRR